MAYEKIYSRVNWENEPSVATPINEDNLNNMDATIDELDDRVVELSRTTPCVQQVDELPEQGVIGVLYQLNTEYAQNFELDGLPDDLKTQANYNLYVSNGGKATMFHTTDPDNPFILIYDCYVSVYFTYKADNVTSDFYVRIMGTGLGTNPRLYTYNKTNKTWTYQAITSGAGDYILKVDGVFRQTVKQVEFPNTTVSNSIGSVLPDCGLEWVSGDENNQQWFYYFYDETSDVPINDAKTYANNLWDIWSGYPYTIATTMYFWNGNGYSHLSNSSELAEYQRLLTQGDGINIDSNNVISTESPKQIFRDWTDNNDTTPYPYSVRYNTDADFKNAYGISTNDILNAVNSGKYYNLNLTILIDIGGIISYDEYSKCSVLYIDYSDMYEGGLSRNFDIFFMSDYHYTWWEDEGGIPIEHTKYYVMMPHVLSVFVQYTDTGAIRYIDAGMHRTYSISDINEGLGVSIDGGLISVKPKQNGGITVNADGVSVSESITNSIDNNTMIGTANGEIATIQDGGNDMPLKSCVVAIEPVQSGSGDPSPQNERPITGWTEANVSLNEINQWDEQWEVGSFNMNTGEKTQDTNLIRSKNFIPILPTNNYYLKIWYSIYNTGFSLLFYDKDKNFISSLKKWNPNLRTSEIPSESRYMMFKTDSIRTTYKNDISINYPSTDTSYHAYTGQTHNIQFPSQAGTVYGGTLDVTNGVLIVDRVMISLSGVTWNITNDGRFYAYINHKGNFVLPTDRGIVPYLISEVYKTVSYAQIDAEPFPNNVISALETTSKFIAIRDTRYTTVEDFTTYANTLNVVLKLATPTTYNLTPTEIKTLLGINNIFADCGDVDVEYVRDATIVINNLLARIQELENA